MMIDELLQKDIIPDQFIRIGVQQISKKRVSRVNQMPLEQKEAKLMDFIRERSKGPIAINTSDANEQHYEMPSAFFDLVLGPHKKYSCAYWQDSDSLIEAEEAMLDLVCQRADLKDGQKILDLGCGWGAFCLHAAQAYPNSEVIAVSNSKNQRLYIQKIAEEKKLDNLSVITTDINDLELTNDFDRVVSIEMFEHMRNYHALFKKVASFLNDEGKLFVHVFCHRDLPFVYEVNSQWDWMAKYFFTGGTMPSRDLFHFFNEDLRLTYQWAINGENYSQTLEAWLKKMDSQKEVLMPILADREGESQADKWWAYWRIFFIACSEFFALNDGKEYFIAHYLFEKNNLQ